MRDFTHNIYIDFLESLKRNDFQFLRVDEFYNREFDENRPFILIRHDVDRRPKSSLEMAKIENRLGVRATYYFRTILKTFKPEIIREISNLEHEIGYHYESLANTNGDYKRAIDDFKKNLIKLRELYPIKTIAMHGRPTSKWDSRDLWKKYNYKEYGIVIEPYFDIDFKEILYITDASRKWNNDEVNLRDRVDSSFNFEFKETSDIIKMVEDKNAPKKIMINIHPEHWSKSSLEWYYIYIIRKTKNFIKKLLIN